MAPSFQTLASTATLLALAPSAFAGFSPSAENNLVVYWGQNSAGGSTTQNRLQTYCNNNGVNVINVSFLNGISTPTTNFANAGDLCTAYAGTKLLNCPQISEDIKYCQSQGKTILLSIGGATYSEGGFSNAAAATAAAQNVWNLFGPNTAAANRPFGDAVVDGFDFDFESSTQNFTPFAQQLRSLMDADASKKYFLSAAPQCVYPDAAMNDMLNGAVFFDWINIQFYNNWCGVINFSNVNAWNFNVWDTWAKTVSKNPNVRVNIGSLASGTAGGGYVSASSLGSIAQDTASKYSSFGGVMLWDMSQLYQNSGFLTTLVSALSSLGGSPVVPSSTTTAAPTTMVTSTKASTTTAAATTTTHATTTTVAPPSTTGVAQWGQCGGTGYTGPTVCQSPYSCVATSVWWSQCE